MSSEFQVLRALFRDKIVFCPVGRALTKAHPCMESNL